LVLFERLLRQSKTSGTHLRKSKLRSGFLLFLASIANITNSSGATFLKFVFHRVFAITLQKPAIFPPIF
jgi:hypothetical protein